mgnify:CR=1 FL=1
MLQYIRTFTENQLPHVLSITMYLCYVIVCSVKMFKCINYKLLNAEDDRCNSTMLHGLERVPPPPFWRCVCYTVECCLVVVMIVKHLSIMHSPQLIFFFFRKCICFWLFIMIYCNWQLKVESRNFIKMFPCFYNILHKLC